MGTRTLQAPSGVSSWTSSRGAAYTADRIGNMAVDWLDMKEAQQSGFLDPASSARLPMVAGRFYLGGNPGDVLAAFLTVVTTLYAVPIYIPNRIALATLGINVTTGQTGGVCRAGICRDNGGKPDGAAVLAAWAADGAATGTALASAAAVATLDPGWHWVLTTFNATSTMPSVSGITAAAISGANSNLGNDTAAHVITGAFSSGMSVAFTYAALPAVLPVGFALLTNSTIPAAILGF